MNMGIFLIACWVFACRAIDLVGFTGLGECSVFIGKKKIGFSLLGAQWVAFSRCSQVGVCLRVENA